jgi:DNA-binding PadR family transcriptional regulator
VRKLKKEKLIEVKEVRPQQGKRPALKIYEVTAAGTAALAATLEHYELVAKYLRDGQV